MATSTPRACSVPLIFDLCELRPDALKGVTDCDFAADLVKVIRGTASPDYKDASNFFANAYSARELRKLMASACERLSGSSGVVASVLELDTFSGCGKTLGLIALVHATNGRCRIQRNGACLGTDR